MHFLTVNKEGAVYADKIICGKLPGNLCECTSNQNEPVVKMYFHVIAIGFQVVNFRKDDPLPVARSFYKNAILLLSRWRWWQNPLYRL